MKKGLLITGGVILLLVFALAASPWLFKNKIKAKAEKSLAESVNAQIVFDNFGLSVFKDFPNISVSVNDFSIVGKDLFQRDTLIAGKYAQVDLNLFSAIFGDQVQVNGIELESPKVLIKILEGGYANYDIAIESDSIVDDSEDSQFSIEIDHWTITDGRFIYDDEVGKLLFHLDAFNHQGSGDFSQDVFDLTTESRGLIKTLRSEGIDYLSNKQLDANITLEMDLPKSKYTFKENTISLNDFAFSFDGWVAMPDEDIDMEINFAAKENDFQSLLSLVPGVYKEGYEDIQSVGKVQFDGFAKGVYSESTIPSFDVKLKVEEAMFQYPDLPNAVENINVDMQASNTDGVLEHTVIDVKQMHMDFGQNPVDGRVLIKGLEKSEVDADIKAKINLAELNTMFPMDGLSMKGLYDLKLIAKGTYDSASQQFPSVDADMILKNGYIKSKEFPTPLENISLVASMQNSNGAMADTRIEVPDFSFIMEGEPLKGNLTLVNLEDYNWDLTIDGGVDLAKLTQIFPLENMKLSGRINGNIDTKGRMSDLEAERYDKLPTSGVLSVKNFSYESADMPHAFNISSAQASFDPQRININQLNATTGSTDLKVTGHLSNYINYIFEENEVIEGNLNLVSNKVDLNEWMTETPTDSSQAETTEIIEIPENIELSINSDIREVLYDNMNLQNVKGGVNLKDGVAQMQQVNFNSLGGAFVTNGSYDTRDKAHPKFDFDMNIKDLPVKEAFNTFNTVQAFAPIAKFVNGNFSTNFNFNGELGQNMLPVLSSLSGGGLVEILEATLANSSKLVEGISNLTKFGNETTKGFSLKDVIMNVSIKNGRLTVKPFEAQFGNYTTRIFGSNGIDGSMDYTLNMDVPAGVVGTSVNQGLAKLTGAQEAPSDIVKLNLRVGGNYNDPKISLGGREGGPTTASMAEDAVDAKVEEAKDSVSAIADEKTEELKQQAKAEADSLIKKQLKDSVISKPVQDITDKVLKDTKVDDLIPGLFKKKKKTETAPADSIKQDN